MGSIEDCFDALLDLHGNACAFSSECLCTLAWVHEEGIGGLIAEDALGEEVMGRAEVGEETIAVGVRCDPVEAFSSCDQEVVKPAIHLSRSAELVVELEHLFAGRGQITLVDKLDQTQAPLFACFLFEEGCTVKTALREECTSCETREVCAEGHGDGGAEGWLSGVDWPLEIVGVCTLDEGGNGLRCGVGGRQYGGDLEEHVWCHAASN
mmetsp:Transcript_36433/g.91695  ORF Transcript_36433/g.91695 Transcript_36433/m.91695 type:complete len:209 (+) Transcript_36433:1125-1751(+)